MNKPLKGAALTVTSIQDSDVPEVIRLWKRAGLVREWNDPSDDIALARKENNSTILLGRDADGAPVASVLVGHDGHRGWVYYVSVDPDHRLKDYGRQIMRGSTATASRRRACLRRWPSSSAPMARMRLQNSSRIFRRACATASSRSRLPGNKPVLFFAHDVTDASHLSLGHFTRAA